MALEIMTDDVEIIQNLGTFPNQEDGLTADELKAKFDAGAAAIKKYLNEQLVPTVQSLEENIEPLKGIDPDAMQDAAARAEAAAATFETDTTLSSEGKAADAAATGAALDGKASLLQVYPVGAIYISTVSASPASLFGGTWEQLKDRFLLGAGGSYAAGAMGGAASITHRHEASGGISAGYAYFDIKNGTKNVTVSSGQGGAVSLNNASITTAVRSYTSEESFNNMPPYLAVYMWKRVA